MSNTSPWRPIGNVIQPCSGQRRLTLGTGRGGVCTTEIFVPQGLQFCNEFLPICHVVFGSDPVSGGNTEDLIFICLRVHTPHEKDMVRANKVVSTTSDGADHDPIQLALVETSDDFESGSASDLCPNIASPATAPTLNFSVSSHAYKSQFITRGNVPARPG